MSKVTVSKKEQVLGALLDGQRISPAEMTRRFGVKNTSAMASSLRMDGYPVYLNEGAKDTRGRRLASKYRIGSTSRKVIAAGYKALASA
jgi:hypothetical protein